MRRPLHVLLAAAAACALLAAALARAQSLDGPMGPFAIQPPPGLAPLYASILQGLDTAARYSNAGLEVPEMVGASAAAPVVNATGEQVATAIGTVMAAAMMQTDALSSLGAPDVFKWVPRLQGGATAAGTIGRAMPQPAASRSQLRWPARAGLRQASARSRGLRAH